MTFVQTATNTGAFPSVVATFGSSTASADLIVIAVSDDSGTTSEVTSVTDNKGNTYIAISTPLQSSTGPTLSWYYAQNITGGSGHAVTVNLAGSSSNVGVVAQEFNSIASGALDVHTTAAGSSTAPSSGATGTTSQASELVVGAVAFGGSPGAATLGSGYTNLGSAAISPANTGMESKVVSSTGAQTATFTITSANWVAGCATFKQTGGGGGGGIPPTPTIPTFTNGTVPHATDLNALGSNFTNLYNYTMAGFYAHKPIAVVRIVGAFSVNTGGYTILQFDTVDYDTDTIFDSYLTNQGLLYLTVRTAGVYRLYLQFTMIPFVPLTDPTEAHVCINGTSVPTNSVSGGYIGSRAVNSEATVGLSVGDRIYGIVWQSTGSSQNTTPTYGGTYLTAEWLSP